MKPRGTTLRLRFDKEPSRKAPWGVWWNEYAPGRTGRPRQRSQWFATAADAKAFMAIVEARLAQPAPAAPPPRVVRAADSLAVLAQEWLTYVEEQRDAATHKNYADCVRNYLAPEPGHRRYPGLGDLVVHDATLMPKVIVDFLNGLHKAGVSLSMRRRVQRSLSALCSYAKYAGRLTKDNPCFDLGRSIRKKGEEDQEAVPNPFTREEIARLFAYVEAHEPDYLADLQFLYDTGVRPGEASAVQWDRLHFDQLRVTIAVSYSPVGKADKLPKTHERRDVDLTRLAADRLLAWRPVQRQELLRRAIQQTPYAFTSRRGKRILQNGNVRLVFDRVMKACGITGHTLYDFRDSFASHHLSDNWDRKLTWVSKQLGHKHVSTTERDDYAYRPTAASRSFADEIRG